MISIEESGQTLKILKTAQLINNLGQMDEEFSVKDNPVLQRTCCRRAFLRGAFLSAGSITDPEKNYHFEIACISSEKAAQIKELFEFFLQVLSLNYMTTVVLICLLTTTDIHILFL